MLARRWIVAYSGGVDSHVLLHLLAHVPDHPPLLAVHINHQLQPEANQWADHCRQQTKQLSLELFSVAVDVKIDARQSLEQCARKARYQVFESLLEPGDVLMMGHHLDDQVETLMLRLLRGSGSRGVAAMPASRAVGHGILFRPLLNTPRTEIELYADQQGLSWIEDPTNQSSEFDRNYIRREILPGLAKRWPEYRQTLARAAALSEESEQLNNELAELDFHSLALPFMSESLPIAALQQLSLPRQKNLLRYWLKARGLALPSVAQIRTLFKDVVSAKGDADPVLTWPGVEVRRFNAELYAFKPLEKIDTAAEYLWDLSSCLIIPGLGSLSCKAVQGSGLRLAALDKDSICVRFRRGGERCRPAGRGHSQTLKKLLQENNIETWLRDRLPLIYCQEQLIAVVGQWVCDGFQAKEGEPGLIIELNSMDATQADSV